MVLAQKRSAKSPTSKLIHGPEPCASRSVAAVRVWMGVSLYTRTTAAPGSLPDAAVGGVS